LELDLLTHTHRRTHHLAKWVDVEGIAIPHFGSGNVYLALEVEVTSQRAQILEFSLLESKVKRVFELGGLPTVVIDSISKGLEAITFVPSSGSKEGG
jgi:hypothetical protein